MSNGSLITGASGLNASRRRLETSAHNVANLNTVGFKKQRTVNRQMKDGVQSVTDRPENGQVPGLNRQNEDPVELTGNKPPRAGELSNVNPAEEAVNRIEALATAKANADSIRTGDEMLGTVVDLKK